ncbi:hypothetical protein [Chryseobacterium luquanense]|uniref:Uncharacterized protein n=1 Tax=Chryseobacterium luquanense TaxID=2983766 RepID=A0ABT3XZM2_9FLAO|nr:hypothetical protein [Chryseobacterium luquanense]MCX8531318.1 hypothetical protein [Chryseobacterium luquanense]
MFFKNIFNKNKITIYSKTNGLSKIEYVEKYQLKNLFTLLHQAEDLIEELALTNSDVKFLKFKNIFIEEICEIEGDNIADITKVWNWFKPHKEWNDFTGSKGIEIGSQIFNITTTWKLDDDFIPGTKVSLDNEYGLILDKGNDCSFGIIRWDTPKEVDEEDWVGMFGTFKESGGKIINESHQFKYINNDGSLKT